MFEIIGILVVVWIGFVIIKSAVNGGIKGTLARASHTAVEQGVPSDFASAAINNPETLIRARKALVNENPKFASMEMHQQYAVAIITSYKIGTARKTEDQTIDLACAKEKVKKFVQPQLEALKREGTPVHINDITFVYCAALATCETKKGISLKQVMEIVEEVFQGEDSEIEIIEAFITVKNSSNFLEKMKLMIPVVSQELTKGEGEFFTKYCRKAAKEIEEMFTKSIDPSEVAADDFLKV